MKYTDNELQQEQWRPIDGYDGIYEVSDFGRVRSLKFGKVKVMKQGKNRKGYLFVNLHRDGKQKTANVHRLVAQAFIENTDSSKTLINHRNEIKSDNRLSNLEYCTAQYNNTYNDLHHRRITKRDKIKGLYNPYLTIDENLLIFKENGIECCRGTVGNLRKELNLYLSRPQPKRTKIKELYNPNLSINENLELFRSKGIECSRETVSNLRKDLGLTKKTVNAIK